MLRDVMIQKDRVLKALSDEGDSRVEAMFLCTSQYLWDMRSKESRLTKKSVLRTLKDMPETFQTEELIERLILLSKVEAGMADVKTGRTLSIEEMREHIRTRWSK